MSANAVMTTSQGAQQLPKIYTFVNGGSPGWWNGIAIAEDGQPLAGHLSSTHGFAQMDLGYCSELKHDLYRAKYPDGYEVVWLNPHDEADDLAIVKALPEWQEAQGQAVGNG